MVEREHGTRARYVFGPAGGDWANGCRCDPCREANRAYARNRDRERRSWMGEESPDHWHVDADAARAHLAWLREHGIGLRTVEARTGLARHTLQQITSGESRRCLARTERLILGTGLFAALPGACIDGDDTRARIVDLLAAGWTKVAIARAILGPQAKALQLRRDRVCARNAKAVAELHASALPHLRGQPHRRLAPGISAPRYPLSALAAAAGMTEASLNRHLGIKGARYRNGLTDDLADELAVRMGLHPLEVWGAAWLVPA